MDKEMMEASLELNEAFKMLDQAETPERIDEATYRILAAQARTKAIIKERRAKGGLMNDDLSILLEAWQ